MADSMSLGSAYAEVTLKQGGAWNAVQASSLNSLQAWNRRAMKLATVALGVVGVAGIVNEVKKAIQVYADFEYAMAGVRAVTNATDADFKKLTEAAKKLGTSTKFNMTQIAQAMEELGRAGFTANQIIATMPGVTNLAAASTLSLSEAAETTMMTLKGMGLAASESARVADVLAAADAASAVSVADLAESLKYITPLAKAAGFSLEETVAAAAALGDAGIKGTMAGTSLRFAFGELLSESDAFKEKVGALGLEMSELYGPDGQLKDFADILTLFSEHGITAGEVMEMMGDRAGVAIINLIQNTPKLKELVATLENSAGAAKRVADIKLDTITGQLGILGSKWEALRVGLIGGTEDATKNFIKNTLIPFVDSIGEWFQKQGGLVGLWERFGDAVKYVGLAFAKIAGVVAILSLVYKALTGLTNPIIYLVALGAALYVAWETNFYGIRDIAESVWKGIVDLFHIDDIIKNLKEGNWGDALTTIAIDVAAVLGTVTIAKDFLTNVLTKAGTAMGGVFNSAVGAITGIGTGLAFAFLINKDKFTLENGQMDWAAYLNQALPAAVAGLIGFAVGGKAGQMLATIFTALAFQFMPQGVGEALKKALGVAGIEQALKEGNYLKAGVTIGLDATVLIASVMGIKELSSAVIRAITSTNLGGFKEVAAGVLGLGAVLGLELTMAAEQCKVDGTKFDIGNLWPKIAAAVLAYGIVFTIPVAGKALAIVAADLAFKFTPTWAEIAPGTQTVILDALHKALAAVAGAMGGMWLGMKLGAAAGLAGGGVGAVGGAVLGAIAGLSVSLLIDLLPSFEIGPLDTSCLAKLLTILAGTIGGAVLGGMLGGGLPGAVVGGFLGTIAGLSIDLLVDLMPKFKLGGSVGKNGGLNDVVKIIGGLGSFQKGGPIPGEGLGDIIPAMLEPGEFVLPNWMMKIPWFSALVRGMWQKGKKMAAGGPAYQVGVAQPEKGWLGLDPSQLEAKILADLGQTVDTVDSVLLWIVRTMAKGAKDQEAVIKLFTVFGKMAQQTTAGLDGMAGEADAAGAALEETIAGLQTFDRNIDATADKLKELFDAIAIQVMLDYNQQIQAYTQLYNAGVTEGNAAKQYAGIAGLEGVFSAMSAALELFKSTGAGTAEATALLNGEMEKLAATYGFTTEEAKKAAETWAGTIDRLVAQLDPSKPEEMAQALQALGGLYETIAAAMKLLEAKGFSEGASALQVLLDKIVTAGGAPLPDPEDAKNKAREAAQAAQDAFMAQFGTAVTDAISGHDWTAAADAIASMASSSDSLVAAAAALPSAEGVEPIKELDVLQAINGARQSLISGMQEELATLITAGQATSDQAQKLSADIEAMTKRFWSPEEIAAENERLAKEAADKASESFWSQFSDPILEAFGSGKWKAALEDIQRDALNPQPVIDYMNALNAEHDLKLSEVDVLRTLIGQEGELIEKLQLRIDLARLAQQWDTVKELEEIKEWIEAQRKSPAQRRQEALGKFLGEWGGTISQAGGMAGVGGVVDAGLSVAEGFASGNPWVAIANVALDGIQWFADKAKEAAEEVKQTFDDVVSGAWQLAQSFSGLITQTQLYQKVMEFGTELLGNLFEGFLGPLSDLFAEILTVFEETVETTSTAITEATEDIVASLNVPYGWKALNRIRYGASFSGQPPVFNTGTASSSTSTLEETAEVVSDIILEFGGEISLLQVALIDLREKFGDVWDDIRPALIEAALSVAWTFVGVMNDTVLPAIQLIVPSLQGAITKSGKVISALLLGLAPVLETVIGAFGMVANFFTNTIGPSLETFFTAFGTWWSTEMDPFLQSDVFPLLGKVAKFLWEQLTGLVNFLGPYVMPLLRDLWGIVEDFWETALKPMVEEFGQWVKDNWPTIREFLTTQLQAWLDGLKTKLNQGIDYFKIKLLDGAGDTAGAIDAIMKSQNLTFWQKMGTLWTLSSANFWEKLGGSVSLLATALWRGFAKVWNFMFGWIYRIPIPKDNVPTAAEGGIPRSAMLAMVGDASVPEPIIPLTPQNLGAIGKGIVAAGGYQATAATSGPVHIHVSVGGRDLGEVVMKSLKANNALQFGPALNPIGG